MASNFAYMRKIVILEEQPDYYKKEKGQNPKGHMNIEIRDGRGKLNLNIDNLKLNPEEEKIYKGYLISSDNKKPVQVELGAIILSENGKGSLEWKFEPTSVGGTSISIEKFNIIFIKGIDTKQNVDNIDIPLAGYIHKKDGSIASIINKQIKEHIEANQEIEPKKDFKTIEEKQIKIKNNNIEDNNIDHTTYENIFEPNILEESIEEKEVEADLDIQETAKDLQYELEQEVESEDIDEEKNEIEKEETKIENIEIHMEEPSVEDLSINDIGSLNIEFDEIEPAKLPMEEWEQEEQEDGFITLGDDFTCFFMGEEPINHLEGQSHQITYNYGIYTDNVDNTYGNKINKIDSYMETVKNYSMHLANYTMDILKFFEKVDPFRENLKDCSWWRIDQENEQIHRGFLPFYDYLINTYYPYPLTTKITTCQSLIEKHKHYIFGIVMKQDEIKYYVYGVPGGYTIEDHPYNGTTGFNTWLKNKDSYEGLGYWLVYIDALSGKIVNPVNPTIPTL